MANITRYQTPSAGVPLRSLIDQIFTDSFFAPSMSPSSWRNGSSPTPLANLLESGDSYVVQVSLPGVDGTNLNVQATGSELRISGSYVSPQPENSTYVFQGLPTGEFAQSFTLPADVAGDGADAVYQDGILTITLPKAEHVKVRPIKVKTSV